MLNKLVRKFQSLKNNYLKRSPRAKWEMIRNASTQVLKIVGLPVLDPNFKLYWLSYFPIVVTTDVCVSFGYTIWLYRDDLMKGLLFIPMLALLIPTMAVYAVVLSPMGIERIHGIFQFPYNHIFVEINENTNPNYIRLCNKSAIELLKKTTKIMLIELTSMFMFSMFPALAYLLYDDIQLPIPVILPFTDPLTKHGFAINFLNQIFIGLFGLVGNIGIEICTCIMSNAIWVFSVAIRYSVDEFNRIIIARNYKQIPKRAEEYQFRNILIQIQDYDRVLLEFSDLYYYKFFTQPYMLTFGVSLSIFFYLYGIWMSGLGAAILCYLQLFIQCDIGNEVELANESLLLTLHDMPWYLLSKEQQLMYAHVFNRLQNGTVLQIGPLDKLNFETFSKMSKLIYSVLAMLHRVLN